MAPDACVQSAARRDRRDARAAARHARRYARSTVIVALGDIYAQVPLREAAEEAMLDAQRAALEQDGCISFAFAEALGEPGHYVVIQRWSGRDALEAHYRSEGFFHYQASIAPLLVRESELTLHTVEDAIRPIDSEARSVPEDDS
jgi:quinol monooxygenase YgiN